MDFKVILKQDSIPEFDPHAIRVQHLELDQKYYSGKKITQSVISRLLQKLPAGLESLLYLDPNGEDDWMEVLCDGTWIALEYTTSYGGGQSYYSYNPDYAHMEELSPLVSGGQPIQKYLTLTDLEAGKAAVAYFIRTGRLYPGIDWVTDGMSEGADKKEEIFL